MRSHTRPWGRMVAGVFAAGILVIAVSFFFTSADMRRCADAAQTAEPIHLKVDLSMPGVYSGDFLHTFNVAYDQVISIEPEPSAAPARISRAMLDGLVAHLTITGPGGRTVLDRTLRPESFYELAGNPAPMTELGDFPPGKYELHLAVDHGAEKLASVPHALVAHYRLSGLEYVHAQIEWLLGIAGCLVAGVLILFIVAITVGKDRKPSAGVLR